MAKIIKSDELLEKSKKDYGDELGEALYFVHNQAANLELRWKTYLELSASGPERVQLLNHSAGTFFAIVQRSLFDDCIMAVCRLTDPPKSFRKPNMSLEYLVTTLSDGTLKNRVVDQVQKAKDAASFQKNHRNKRIAHNDFKLITSDDSAHQLESATVEKMNLAIKAIWQPICEIHAKLGDTHLITELPPISNGAVSLLNCLFRGQMYNQKIENMMQSDLDTAVALKEAMRREWLVHGYDPKDKV